MLRRTKLSIVALSMLSAVLISLPASAMDIPTLWGVDEDDGTLFSIDDYPTLTGLIDYGRLKCVPPGGGAPVNVGRHIEAFTLDGDGTGFMAVNNNVCGVQEPVFLSFNIEHATTTSANVVAVLGQIQTGEVTFLNSDNISGLSIHPLTGELYALFRHGGPGVLDRLLIVDKTNGSLIEDLGTMTGLGHTVDQSEDIEFDSLGNLFVTDNADDHLYEVDPNTGEIIALLDLNEAGGLGVGSAVKFEGLGWDPINDVLVGTDDNNNLFALLTLENGNNFPLGSLAPLTDVEGIDFVPKVCGDGLLGFNEGCDDQNTENGDGCSDTCLIEDGWECFGEPSLCDPICGDDKIRGAEDCDDGNTANGDCCSSSCNFEPVNSSCGNPTDDACTDADTCDGAGTCDANDELDGTACGDQGVECH